MRHTPRKTSAGFTLVEMLIVAPTVILIIAGFIAVMINMVGSVLIAQEKSRVTYGTEQALSQIDLDVRTATQFPTTTGLVNSPQGSNDNGGAWTTSTTSTTGPLILLNYATTANPVNATGGSNNSLFYITGKPNSCASANRIYNSTYTLYTVYFIKNNNLYRRTILPNVYTTGQPPKTAANGGDICDVTASGRAPWQVNSCTSGSGGYCTTKDDLVADNISAMQLTYYLNPSDTTATTDQASATTIGISLTTTTSAAGQSYTYTGTLRTSRANAAP